MTLCPPQSTQGSRRAQGGTCTTGIISPQGRHSPNPPGIGLRDEELLRNLDENSPLTANSTTSSVRQAPSAKSWKIK